MIFFSRAYFSSQLKAERKKYNELATCFYEFSAATNARIFRKSEFVNRVMYFKVNGNIHQFNPEYYNKFDGELPEQNMLCLKGEFFQFVKKKGIQK